MENIKNVLDIPKFDPEFEFDVLLLDIGELIVKKMDKLDISRKKLAKLSGLKKERIKRILDGFDDVSLMELVKISCALEHELKIAGIKEDQIIFYGFPTKANIFGIDVAHYNEEEAAEKSSKKFVIGDLHIAEYDPNRNPTGKIISAYEAYQKYGMKKLKEIIDYGSALIFTE